MNWFDILKKDPWQDRPVDVSMILSEKCCGEAREGIVAVYQDSIDRVIERELTKPNPDPSIIKNPKGKLKYQMVESGGMNMRMSLQIRQTAVEKMNCKKLHTYITMRKLGGGKRPKAFNETYRQWDACVRGAWIETDLEGGPGSGKPSEFRDRWA